FGLRAARGGEAFRRGLFFFAPDLSALAAKKEVVGAEAPAVARHVAGGHPAGSDMHLIAIERPAYRVLHELVAVAALGLHDVLAPAERHLLEHARGHRTFVRLLRREGLAIDRQ